MENILDVVSIGVDECSFCGKESAVAILCPGVDYECSGVNGCSSCLEKMINILPRYE